MLVRKKKLQKIKKHLRFSKKPNLKFCETDLQKSVSIFMWRLMCEIDGYQVDRSNNKQNVQYCFTF